MVPETRSLADRRTFLAGTVASLATLWSSCSSAASAGRVRGANEDLRLGFVGLRQRGRDLLGAFRKVPGVRVAALCDCDREFLDREAAAAEKRGEAVAMYRDFRALLDSRSVDAVVIATPNHWHALMAVWACEAGMDVYVEKPVCHDVWEGAALVATAERTGRVVAAGHQARSSSCMQEAIGFARSGALGRIELARGLCYKRRKSIGRVTGEQPVPAGCDYELWTGPAPLLPLQRSSLHYDWHWNWATGNGDLGNQGVHQVDQMRWALGMDRLPTAVLSVGARLGYQDDGETPNTMITWYGGASAPMLFEVRGLPTRRNTDEMDQLLGTRVGVVLHCEGGYVVLPSYESAVAYDREGRELRRFEGNGDHAANFIAAVRARDHGMLNATVREGALSAAFCHLGNQSWRQGAELPGDALRAAVQWRTELAEAYLRMEEHLRSNGIDLVSAAPLRLGAMLQPDADLARHVRREYRKPFELPESAASA